MTAANQTEDLEIDPRQRWASGAAAVAAALADSPSFAALHTLSLSHAGAALTDAAVRDVLAPRLPQLRELFLPHNDALESAACVDAAHWRCLQRLSFHSCDNLAALWRDVDAIPGALLHVDVTDCARLLCVPSPLARAIAARGGRFGIECDQPQCVFDGTDDDDDSGSVSIATNALTPERLRLFDAVVSLCGEADLPRGALSAWAGAALHVDVEDDEAAVLPLAHTTAFLRAHRGQRRLVHCVVGASRSAATIVAWLVADRGLALEQALAQLRAVRPICAPNPAFMAQLHRWTEEQQQQQQRPSTT